MGACAHPRGHVRRFFARHPVALPLVGILALALGAAPCLPADAATLARLEAARSAGPRSAGLTPMGGDGRTAASRDSTAPRFYSAEGWGERVGVDGSADIDAGSAGPGARDPFAPQEDSEGIAAALGRPSREATRAGDEKARAPERKLRVFPVEGTLRGSLRRAEADHLEFRGAKARTRIGGTPFDFGALTRGDEVEIPYRLVGDKRWLWPALQVDERPATQRFAVQGIVRGPILRLDRREGRIDIGHMRLRAHPADLADMGVGQMREVRFVEIGTRLWLHSSAPVDISGGEALLAPRSAAR